MIKYSAEEKAAAKLAKKAYKANAAIENKNKAIFRQKQNEAKERLKNAILDGIMPSEYEMNDNDPVHGNYLYVAVTGDKGKVFRSDVFGTVKHLKLNMGCEKIFTCDFAARKLF